jgi:hypothetical protein
LGNVDIKPAKMTLQLADKSTTAPYGVAQDMLVKVDKFFFPVDFIIIDMEEDDDAPLILGRPFMKTARMMIDVDNGLMKVRVQNEEVAFHLFEAKKHLNDKHDSFRIDATEEKLVEVANQVHISNPSERPLIGVYQVSTKTKEKKMEAWLHELEAYGELFYHDETREGVDMTNIVEEPKLEPHLKYVYLDDNCTKPVIISNNLSTNEENQLMRVLKKKEVVKLVEAGMNCSIADGEWVSVVQIVPKKGGIRFYRRFIKNLVKTTKPLRKLLKKMDPGSSNNKVDRGSCTIPFDAPL